jgi:hypothetical protein
LWALLRLTETEVQVTETRRAQARTEAVERELRENAENARERARLVAAALRERGGVPDVVTTVAGRLAPPRRPGWSRRSRCPRRCWGTSRARRRRRPRGRAAPAAHRRGGVPAAEPHPRGFPRRVLPDGGVPIAG